MALADAGSRVERSETRAAGVAGEARLKEMRVARRAALRDVVPVVVATLPLALAVGMTIAQTAVSVVIGWLAAPMLFAGSAHLALVSVLGAGGSPLVAIGAGTVINARFAVYSAALAPLFERQPRWFRYVGPHFMVDQTFALVATRPERHDPEWMRAYYLWVSAAIATMWLSGVSAGIVLEPVLPRDWPVSIAGPLMVAGLLGGSLRSTRAVAVATVGFLVGALLAPIVGATAIIVAGVAGILAGRVPVPARTED